MSKKAGDIKISRTVGYFDLLFSPFASESRVVLKWVFWENLVEKIAKIGFFYHFSWTDFSAKTHSSRTRYGEHDAKKRKEK